MIHLDLPDVVTEKNSDAAHDFERRRACNLDRAERSNLAISGQRGINTNVTVDGVDFNNVFFGGTVGGAETIIDHEGGVGTNAFTASDLTGYFFSQPSNKGRAAASST